MLRYIMKRTFYSLLIIGGVMILTFILFHLSSGDPASTVLGKNPSPEELENMRTALGSNKPLFYGKWKSTCLYPGADFTSSRLPGNFVRIQGKYSPSGEGLLLEKGALLSVKRAFKPGESVKEVRVEWIQAKPGGKKVHGSRRIRGTPDEVVLSFPEKTLLCSYRFFLPNKHVLDSQLTGALKELICLSGTFPYISVFNFGKTLQSQEPIREKLFRGMVPSLLLMLPVFFGELLLGILLGMIAAVRHGKFSDQLILFFSVAGMSISYLVLILFGQWFFAYYLDLFPVWGWGDIRYLLLPVAIGILNGAGGGVRFYRTVFLDELNREYIRTAHAKGIAPVKVYFKHLLKNALIPVITRASTVLPFLFTGSLLLETFFGIPGLGYASINALNDGDLQMLKALVIVSALLFTLINLLTDLAYAWADPRVRLK